MATRLVVSSWVLLTLVLTRLRLLQLKGSPGLLPLIGPYPLSTPLNIPSPSYVREVPSLITAFWSLLTASVRVETTLSRPWPTLSSRLTEDLIVRLAVLLPVT